MSEWIFVAGAASGIGRKTAEELYKYDYSVILADVNKPGLQEIQSQLPGSVAIVADLINEAEIRNTAEFISGRGITLSGVVDTVGKAVTMPVKSSAAKLYEDIFTTNVFSFQLLVTELLAFNLLKSERASIVVISSITGELGAKGKTAYGASKGALNSLVRSMALELADDKIRVNAISPGSVQSEMLENLEANIGKDKVEELKSLYPLGFGNPEDVSNLVVFLLSNYARWMTGNVLTVDGGYSSK